MEGADSGELFAEEVSQVLGKISPLPAFQQLSELVKDLLFSLNEFQSFSQHPKEHLKLILTELVEEAWTQLNSRPTASFGPRSRSSQSIKRSIKPVRSAKPSPSPSDSHWKSPRSPQNGFMNPLQARSFEEMCSLV